MPSYGEANQKREFGLTIAAPALRYGPVAKVNQALLIQFRGMDWIVHLCADRGLACFPCQSCYFHLSFSFLQRSTAICCSH
jgi:hypothetical protein